jgi:poly-gamma-glutamate synthesis protein (capsule biosynthesis protein)
MRKQNTRPPVVSHIIPFLIYFFLMLPGEPAHPTYTLAFVGDVMLGRGVAQALDGNWEAAFAEVQPWLAEADLACANLESPLTTAPQLSPGYDLRGPPEAVAALRAAGFDVVSLANNHALDAGGAGLRESVDALSRVGIMPLTSWGIGRLVDWSPQHQSTNYQSTSHQPTNPPAYRLLAFDDSITPLDLNAATQAVTDAATGGEGTVIISIHWGGEYQAAPGPRQEGIARALAEAGANVIVGHGPHVLQRIEWIGETLVAYSLGNFLFDQPYPVDCRQGAILRVTLRGGEVASVEVVPTVTERGRVKLAGAEDAAAILARLDTK